jgi:hypothetical protein
MAGQTSNMNQFAISPETTAFTYLAPVSGEYIPHKGGEFDETHEMVVLEDGMGLISSTRERKVSKLMGSGAIPFPLGARTSGIIFGALIGRNPVTTGAGPYVHTYTPLNSNAHQTCSIVRIPSVGSQKFFTGQMLDTASIKADMNGEQISLETTWMGGPTVSQSNVTPAYSTEDYFYPDQLTLEIKDSGVSFTSADGVINNVTVDFAKNVLASGQLGSNKVTRVYNQNFECSGTITTYRAGDTEFAEAIGNNRKKMRLIFTSGTNKIEIQLNELSFSEPKVSADINGIETLERQFVVHRAVSNVSIILTNGQSAYPLT